MKAPLAAALLLAACAGTAVVWPAHAITTDIPASGLPTAGAFSAAILPERPDVVSWRTLAQVEPVKQGKRMVPSFSRDVLALDAKTVKVQGFMIPLDVGEKQKRFLVTAVPSHCPFCLPAGPDGMVEVVAKEPVRYSLEPIVVSGHFTVLKDDENGLLYRLTDAAQVEVVPLSPKAKAALGVPASPDAAPKKQVPPGAK